MILPPLPLGTGEECVVLKGTDFVFSPVGCRHGAQQKQSHTSANLLLFMQRAGREESLSLSCIYLFIIWIASISKWIWGSLQQKHMYTCHRILKIKVREPRKRIQLLSYVPLHGKYPEEETACGHCLAVSFLKGCSSTAGFCFLDFLCLPLGICSAQRAQAHQEDGVEVSCPRGRYSSVYMQCSCCFLPRECC